MDRQDDRHVGDGHRSRNQDGTGVRTMPDTSKCGELKKALELAIEDERKAQREYNEMAIRVEEVLCGGACAQGVMASDGVIMVASDENKHEKFLRQLLEQVEKVCPP